MSDITYSALGEHLAGGIPSPVYFICGEEGYLRRRSLDRLKAQYMPSVMPEFNYSEFDGGVCTAEEIAAAAETFPMMAERRMIVVKDLDAATLSGEQFAKLEALLKEPYDTCVLIFFQVSAVKASQKSGDKQSAMRTLIKKSGTVINCKTPSAAEITDILLHAAAEMGAQLSRSDAACLVERCGSDITNLLSELHKLHAMCGGVITRTAIEQHTTQSIDVKGYMLASHVIQGRRRDAFAVLEDLFGERTEPVVVLAMMAGAFIDLYRAKLASGDRKTAEDMAAMFGSEYKGKEKRLSYSFRDSRRYSTELLRQWCCILFDTDRALKSSRVDGKILLEQALAKLFHAAEVFR